MENTEVDLEALLSVPSVTGYDVSNDDEIVFASNTTGQFQLYLGKLARDGLEDCKQLTSDDESKVSPKFYPDSKKILYASDQQGDEKFNLYTYNIDTSGVSNLTPGTDFAIFPNATFSDDGKKIAYVSNESGEFATYLLNVDSLRSKRVSNHEYSDGYAVITPGGSQIAISSAISGQDSGIFLASSDNFGKEPLRLLENGVQIDADQQVWSPDGKKLAFVSSSRGWYDIGIWDIEKDSINWITKSDHEYSEP
ncbi:MAG: PD40 domain-containing protein, partial [Nitrososphaerota archaeon]|nr:PD40 domain-containing protein [Nitrososphaerota archaeon]